MERIKSINRLFFGLILSLALMVACSPSYQLFTDQDPRADFSRLKTYQIVHTNQDEKYSDLTYQRIEASIQTLMDKRGYVLADTLPDLIIAFDGRVQQKKEVVVDRTPGMYDPRWGYYGWDNYQYREYSYQQGTLVIDFVLADEKRLIWQGGAQGNIQGNNLSEKEARKIVSLIFSQYPYVAESNTKVSSGKARALSTFEE